MSSSITVTGSAPRLRADIVDGLHPPVRALVLHGEAARRAWAMRDLERTDQALGQLSDAIEAYVDGLMDEGMR